MTSILTNSSANAALQVLNSVNKNLETTENRISSGLKVTSGKDNAAYYSISEKMKGDSSTYTSISDGLTVAANSLKTASTGASAIEDLAQQFLEKVSFAQNATGGQTEIGNDLSELVKQMQNTLSSSTFNGDDMVGASGEITAGAIAGADGTLTTATSDYAKATRDVVTGVSRASGDYTATTLKVGTVDLGVTVANFAAIATGWATNATDTDTAAAFLKGALATTEGQVAATTAAATQLSQSQASLEGQQAFLSKLSDTIDEGVSSMIEANMEDESARLTALQTQQQLATKALSIANQTPQNVLNLFN